MSRLEREVTRLQGNTPLLIHTTEIPKDLQGRRWEVLREEYEAAVSSEAKILTSILNAIVTQERVFYCITRNTVRDLVANDPNWKDRKPGFRQERWKSILRLLISSGLGTPTYPGTGRRPTVYRLGDDWVNLLGFSDSKTDQETEVLDFVGNAINGDRNGT
ncbi:MAG: hypothetical protein AB7N80_14160 [Bdellovibrionales bacterium]